MEKNKLKYRKYAAFINRQTELNDLKIYIDQEPESILFLHGPKSSGKTVLLYKFLDQVEREQKLDVKYLNLRKIFTEFSDNYSYKDFLSVFFSVDDKDEKKGKLKAEIHVGFFKINSEIEKKMKKGRVDPFKVMEREFIKLKDKGIKSILIIDELQALDKVYMNNGRDRQLIIELFNFFVAMTKESHLAHIIIASSDGYFLNTVYNDSKLKKTSTFYKVDYLPKEDVMEWLLNLEKYSGIKDYTLTREDVEKIWEVVGGSMWEIQDILGELFDTPVDKVLDLYKKKTRGIIAYYCQFDMNKKQVLKLVNEKGTVSDEDFESLPLETSELKEILRDMVTNNILYFDPTEAVYYPQGKSYQWGIRLYFEQ
ncbi:MAG: AAA family ATPase [Candidatus Aminicenantes bacterium]|nr:AAA family ATPase [Candidatus Aminicenantes bacterium]NIM78415.1 AAA family ATPase [Candidatus Aminicenantes bacterium]NIN17677.1 AAA family ATPase [Candidatus Aminicenantes bacterium]NIN41553.1 AAA family ATPase [Candidatus Aminicenantes bacterium]NIN84327.1 AAA family ATPase [Candidatus Aminicenantes bacterium]